MGQGRLLRRHPGGPTRQPDLLRPIKAPGKTTLAQVIANTLRALHRPQRRAFRRQGDPQRGGGELNSAPNTTASAPSSSSTRCTVSTRRNGTRCCLEWRTARSSSSALQQENPYFEVNKALVSRSRIFQLTPLDEDDLRHRAPGIGRQGRLRQPACDRGRRRLCPLGGRGERRCARRTQARWNLPVETTDPVDPGPPPTIHVSLAIAEESISAAPCSMTKKATTTSTRSAPSSRACAAATPTQRSTGWQRCFMPANRLHLPAHAHLRRGRRGHGRPQRHPDGHGLRRRLRAGRLARGPLSPGLGRLYLATAGSPNSISPCSARSPRWSTRPTAACRRICAMPAATPRASGTARAISTHAYRDHWVAQYLPTSLQGKVFYEPSDQGYEAAIRLDVAFWRAATARLC